MFAAALAVLLLPTPADVRQLDPVCAVPGVLTVTAADPAPTAQPALHTVGATGGGVTARQFQPDSGPLVVLPAAPRPVTVASLAVDLSGLSVAVGPPVRVLFCSWQI